MSEDQKREERRARMGPGYRESIREPVDEAQREDLRAQLAEMDARLKKIQERLDGQRDPAWLIALRVGAAVAVWGGLVGAGAWLGGLWGALAALVAPVALLLLWAVVSYHGGKLIRGAGHPVGDLSLHLIAEERRVLFTWTGPDSALPLGLLAQLDRSVWEWGRSPPFAARGRAIARAARIAAEAHLEGKTVPDSEWKAEPGERGDRSVSLERNRLGIEYSTMHSIGGGEASADDKQAATLALIDYGLNRADGARFARAVIDVAAVYEKGGENARRVIRALGKVFAPGE